MRTGRPAVRRQNAISYLLISLSGLLPSVGFNEAKVVFCIVSFFNTFFLFGAFLDMKVTRQQISILQDEQGIKFSPKFKVITRW